MGVAAAGATYGDILSSLHSALNELNETLTQQEEALSQMVASSATTALCGAGLRHGRISRAAPLGARH